MGTDEQMLLGLVINATENYVARRTEAGVAITQEEALLFAANLTLVLRAVLHADVKGRTEE